MNEPNQHMRTEEEVRDALEVCEKFRLFNVVYTELGRTELTQEQLTEAEEVGIDMTARISLLKWVLGDHGPFGEMLAGWNAIELGKPSQGGVQ